ncbi:MAG TPA: hypothetical protein VEC14_13150 [Reyranellaceae bacterium]|nr:hypothetical protein [Reyranellaceae bacterium]
MTQKMRLGLTEHSAGWFGLDLALAALVADGRLTVEDEGKSDRARAINALAAGLMDNAALTSRPRPPKPDITVTLNRPDLDAEAKRARARRAAEVLKDAGWAFDEFIAEQTTDLLATGDDQPKRERIFNSIQAAADLKAHLIRIVQQQEAENTLNERRNRDERPADHG